MNTSMPNPDKGYKIREYLGGGFWKRAYRASSDYSTADVALLYFRDESRNDIIQKDVVNLIRATKGREYSSYLAKFHGIQFGKDGRLFIIEELLERPLDRLAPLNDLVLFSRIARDLCRGLSCLHNIGLVHRDLKLDNCGLDHLKKAKIFDLGSATSEPGGIEGTILTRAPELFDCGDKNELFAISEIPVSSQEQVFQPCDIWGLGATLLALRSGNYPFVYDNEISARRIINAKVANGKISEVTAKAKKKKIDDRIAERVCRPGAFTELKQKVHVLFRGRAEEISNCMLDPDPGKRHNATELAGEWTDLCNELGGARLNPIATLEKWDQILLQLTAVERQEFVLTRKQLERLISEVYDARKQADDDKIFEKIDGMLRKIKVRTLEGQVSAV